MIKVRSAAEGRWLDGDDLTVGLYLGRDEEEIRKNALDAMIALDEFLHPWAEYGEVPEYGLDVELKRDDGEIVDGFLVSLAGVNKWMVDGLTYDAYGPGIIGWRYPADGGRRWQA